MHSVHVHIRVELVAPGSLCLKKISLRDVVMTT